MKKFLSIILIIAMVLAFTGCGNTPNPDDFANDFCEAIRTYDLDAFGDYIGKDLTDWADNWYDAQWYGLLLTVDTTEYKIIQKTENKDDTVDYIIRFEYNDYSEIIDTAYDKYLVMCLEDLFDPDVDDYDADLVMERAFEEAFAEYEPIRTTSDLSLTVKLYDGKWGMKAYNGAGILMTKGMQ